MIRDIRFVVVNQLITDGVDKKYWVFAILSNSAGTLLLWFCFLTLVQVIVEILFEEIEKINSVAIIISGFSTLILIALLFSDPFATEPNPTPSFGLTPSLRSPFITFHPLFAFAAYSLSIISYAIFVSGTPISQNLIRKVDMISLFIGFLLISSILSGAIWSFEVLWGGHWTWDIIENLSLVIFLSSIIPIHLRKQSNEIRIASHALMFPLVLFASFIIRSNLISGNHSYVSSTTSILYLLMFIVSIIPFKRVKIKDDFIFDLTFTDFGKSIWLACFFVILLSILVSTITLAIYNLFTTDNIEYPNLIFHHFITNLMIIPLLIVILIDLKQFIHMSITTIQLTIVIFIIFYILAINYQNPGLNSISLGALSFVVTPIILNISANKLLGSRHKLKRTSKHISRLFVHILFLIFIFSFLISHYSERTQSITMTQNSDEEILNKNIMIMDVSLKYLNDEGFYTETSTIKLSWELVVRIKIDNRIGIIYGGWNPQHDFYTIPMQINYLFNTYQISLQFVGAKTFYFPKDESGSGDQINIFFKARTVTGGYLFRLFQIAFPISFLVPFITTYQSPFSQPDYYE